MKTLRETAETFALNQWLSDAPCDMTYEEILDWLRSDKYLEHEEIIAWQPIEDYNGEEIAEMIDDTRRAFERHAGELLSCTHE